MSHDIFKSLDAEIYSASLLNNAFGNIFITVIIIRQNHGIYTSPPHAIREAITAPTRAGVAHNIPFLKFLVIGVSTNPGLNVVTLTPDLYKRCLNPDVKAVTMAFALPYT